MQRRVRVPTLEEGRRQQLRSARAGQAAVRGGDGAGGGAQAVEEGEEGREEGQAQEGGRGDIGFKS
eukprot:14294715-Alexandrium_andersonii.AAC.1